MSKDQKPSFIGQVVAITFLLILLSAIVQFISLFPTEERVKEFEESLNWFSRFLKDGKPLYESAYSLLLSVKQNQGLMETIEKEGVSKALSVLFKSAMAHYLLVIGALLGMLSLMGSFLVLLVISLLVVFLYKNREFFEDWNIRRTAKRLNPFKRDEKITHLIAMFLKNPVPASVLHHNPQEGGLLEHSLRVAKLSAKRAKELGLSVKEAFLAGLLHDVGKLKIYRKVKASSKTPAPSPFEKKRQEDKEAYVWEGLNVNQEVVNKLFLKELEGTLGISIPKNPQIWEVVKWADMMATEEELKKGLYDIRRFFIPALKSLPFDGPKKAIWKKGEYLIVLAHAFNRAITEKLLEEEPFLPLSTEPDRKGVHVIAYSVVKKLPLIKEIDKIKADDLGLFDAQIGKVVFNGVYVFPAKYYPELNDTQEEVKFLERRTNS